MMQFREAEDVKQKKPCDDKLNSSANPDRTPGDTSALDCLLNRGRQNELP